MSFLNYRHKVSILFTGETRREVNANPKSKQDETASFCVSELGNHQSLQMGRISFVQPIYRHNESRMLNSIRGKQPTNSELEP